MVKPPLRTKSIGFKVSEDEYAQLETAAQAEGRTLGEWCREAILRGGSASDADPALAEIVGVRLLLVNVLRPLAAGEKILPEAFDKLLDQISEVKHELAAKLQQQAARKNPQPEKNSGDGKR
jgi:hypothetical protein